MLSLPAVESSLTPTDILDRSRELCRSAAILVAEAKAQIAEVARHRSEKTQWRTVWSEYSLRSDHVLVCCASCGRLHRTSGEWIPIASEISKRLYRWDGATLSHSVCPDCVPLYLPPELLEPPQSH